MKHAPFFFAAVLRAKASEPLLASDKQKDARVSVANRGKYFFFCASVPNLLILVLTNVF